MEQLGIGVIGLGLIAVVMFLFWFDYQTSACGYGGADDGTDNWAIRFIRRHMRSVKRGYLWLRKPRVTADDYSDFKDVFSL